MSENKTGAYQLALALDALSSAKKPYSNGACGQIAGCESYVLKGTGFSFSCIDEAARKLLDLEEANVELVEALKQLTDVIKAGNLLNLSRGVELGSTVWYVKAHDAMVSADKAIVKHGGK